MGTPSFRTLAAFLYCAVTPVVAWATGVTLQQTLNGITPQVFLVVSALSFVLGLASLLNFLKTEDPPRFPVFVAAHMLSAWCGGMAAFVISEWYEVNDWAEVGFIMAAAYAGTRVLDVMRDRVLALLPTFPKLPPDGPASK